MFGGGHGIEAPTQVPVNLLPGSLKRQFSFLYGPALVIDLMCKCSHIFTPLKILQSHHLCVLGVVGKQRREEERRFQAKNTSTAIWHIPSAEHIFTSF